jgi:hypothetical protein
MALFGPFVDKQGPVVPAAYFNALDAIQNAMQADSGGALTVQIPTLPEPTLILNALPGEPGLGVQGGSGIQVAAGALGGGIVIGQDPTGFGSFNNLANQGWQFTGGDLLLIGTIASSPSIGVTTSDAAHQFAIELFTFGSPTTYATFWYNGNVAASIDPGLSWIFGPVGSGSVSGQVMNIVTATNNYGLVVRPQHPLVSGQSYGVQIQAGSTFQDVAFEILNSANTTLAFYVRGDGFIAGYGPYARTQGLGLVEMTPDRGTFTGTLTGFTSTVSGTFGFFRIGAWVTIYATAQLSGTSNNTSMSLQGVPSSLWPSTAQTCSVSNVFDASVSILGEITAGPGNNFNFNRYFVTGSNLILSLFTGSGLKGLTQGAAFSYSTV